MSSPIDLKVFRASAAEIRKAEAAAWFHNAGKLTMRFFAAQVASKFSAYRYFCAWLATSKRTELASLSTTTTSQHYEATLHVDEEAAFPDRTLTDWLRKTEIDLSSIQLDKVPVAQLIELQDYRRWWVSPDGEAARKAVGLTDAPLAEALRIAHHHASGEEKASLKGEQPKAPWLSSVFGYSWAAPDPGTLWPLLSATAPGSKITTCPAELVHPTFSNWMADTRWPLNDITLFDISAAAAAFLKARIAGKLLDASSGHYSFLRVSIDGAAFWGQAERIPDLLARRALINRLWDSIRGLMESEIAIANEVYRDESHQVFLLPNLSEDGSQERNEELRSVLEIEIRERAAGQEALAGEFVPAVTLHPDTQPDDKQKPRTGLWAIRQAEAEGNTPDLAALAKEWNNEPGAVCTVCGLRPIGRDRNPKQREKQQARKVCAVCEKRRENRSEAWASEGRSSTIWIDEIADANGRLALIAGRLDILPWLTEPEYLEPKAASFGRLSRVWRATKRFWRECLDDAIQGRTVTKRKGRLRLNLASGATLPGKFHAYFAKLGDRRLSAVYIPDGNYLLSAEAHQDWGSLAQGFPRAIEIEEPTGYGSANKSLGNFSVASAVVLAEEYSPAVDLLDDPHSAMLLVPADEALRAASAIWEKYNVEMGKVRQRLPLRLGIVFATSSIPMGAVIDAARRMIAPPFREESWRLKTVVPNGTHVRLCFDNGESWEVPCTMGDGTGDVWYPWFFCPVRRPKPDPASADPPGESMRNRMPRTWGFFRILSRVLSHFCASTTRSSPSQSISSEAYRMGPDAMTRAIWG